MTHPTATTQPQLTAFVQTILSDARIESIAIPNADPLQLYLLNDDFPKGNLPTEVATQLMDQPFYWAFCWASGAALAEMLIKNPEWVKGKRVLDFGSGSGVVAVAAALAGAKSVTACDIDPMAIVATKENAALNQVTLSYADDFFSLMSSTDEPFDLILAADILYDKDNMHWLDVFADHAKSVLVADSRVKFFDHHRYKKLTEFNRCTFPDLDESKEFRRVNVYTLISD